mmetsp:Transcript_87168/g.224488  ORF Transcript_87168/g.224488 Transcript_87168/m.224488 type:complete len:230 (+) Transcript_87168:12-701(+)
MDGRSGGQAAAHDRPRRGAGVPRRHGSRGAPRGAGLLHGRADASRHRHGCLRHGPGQAGHPPGRPLRPPKEHRKLHPGDRPLLPRRRPGPLHGRVQPGGLQGHALDRERRRRGQHLSWLCAPAARHALRRQRWPRPAQSLRCGSRCVVPVIWFQPRRGRQRVALLCCLRGKSDGADPKLLHRRAALRAGALRLPREGSHLPVLMLPDASEAPLLPLRPCRVGRAGPTAA